MVPRQRSLPLTIMASRVHSISHSSMLQARGSEREREREARVKWANELSQEVVMMYVMVTGNEVN